MSWDRSLHREQVALARDDVLLAALGERLLPASSAALISAIMSCAQLAQLRPAARARRSSKLRPA